MTRLILIILLLILLLIVLFPKTIKKALRKASKNITLKLLKYIFNSNSKTPQSAKDTRREGEIKIEKRPRESERNNIPDNSEEYTDFEEIE